MEEINVSRIVNLLIHRHGAMAAEVAAQGADDAEVGGETMAAELWQRVLLAVHKRQLC